MTDGGDKKRVKLNLDDLVVESFDTLPGGSAPAEGTVRAFETQTCGLVSNPCYSGCESQCSYSCGTACGGSGCNTECGGYTCNGETTCGGGGQTQTCGLTQNSCGGNTCDSCQFTCTPACQSAWTYASCGGSCEETDCPGQGNCTQIFPYCNQV